MTIVPPNLQHHETPSDVVVHAAMRAGFSGTHLIQAVAVSFAENSGHNPHAVYTNSDSYHSRDRGLWQINSHWHPEVSDACAFDPDCSAKAAYRISHGGQNWSPWATWPQPAQSRYGAARAAISHAGSVPAAGGIGIPLPGTIAKDVAGILPNLPNPLAPLQAIGGFFLALLHGHTWVRVFEVVGGGILLLVAIYMLFKELGSEKHVRALQGGVRKAHRSTIGRVAKVATKAAVA